MKIYLGGPMSNIPLFNFPAFFAAATKLREQGNRVFSPAERDVKRHGEAIYKNNTTGSVAQAAKEVKFDLRKTFAEDLQYISLRADAVALLPGWEQSRGACVEKAVAEYLGLQILILPGEQPVRVA